MSITPKSEQFFRIKIKPTTRGKTMKKIVVKPLTDFLTNIKKSMNKSLGRIPYIQEKQIHVSTTMSNKTNPMYGKGLKKNKTKKIYS
jgi:hypothetical protein